MQEQHAPDTTHQHHPAGLLVSVITPFHNGEAFLPQALQSVIDQTYRPLELCLVDDVSFPAAVQVVEDWLPRLQASGVQVVFIRNTPKDTSSTQPPLPRGVGYSRNRAIEASHGPLLCILDADDVMQPTRVQAQVEALMASPWAHNTILGTKFVREPVGSTPYYEAWLNGLSHEQLYSQQYRECTVIVPTWMFHRDVYESVGGFDEEEPFPGEGIPEDLMFFNRHLDQGGKLMKLDQVLVMYRNVPGSASHKIASTTLQKVRLPYLERRVLELWPAFTIWGYGRDGRKIINLLSPAVAHRLVAFCDVDPKKVGRSYFIQGIRKHVPVIHYTEATPPLLICVGSKRFGGDLEANIASLDLKEGVDYYHFC